MGRVSEKWGREWFRERKGADVYTKEKIRSSDGIFRL